MKMYFCPVLVSPKSIFIQPTYAVEDDSVLQVESHIEEADEAVHKIKLKKNVNAY